MGGSCPRRQQSAVIVEMMAVQSANNALDVTKQPVNGKRRSEAEPSLD
jgi:hypothetical protein